MTAKRLILFVLGLCALTLLGGVAAANLSILALGNTEGAFFFFLLGCGLAAVIGLGPLVSLRTTRRQRPSRAQMRFRQWLSRLAKVVPSEERDGIHMTGPCWEVHGQVDHCAFLRALPSVVPQDAILFLEGGDHPPALRDFIQANAVPAAAIVRRGTVWPKELVFHLPATIEVLSQLADLAEHCAVPEVCSHLHVYRGRAVLVEWHDAFDPPFYLSKALPHPRVQSFCAQLGVSHQDSMGDADLLGN